MPRGAIDPVIFHRRSKWNLLLFLPLFLMIPVSQINKQPKETESYNAAFAVLNIFAGFLAGSMISNFILAVKELYNLKRPYKESLFKCLEYFYSFDVPIFIVVAHILLYCRQDWTVFLLTMVLNVLLRFFYSSSLPEVHELCEKHKLNIGYGAAVFYYHNYLKLFIPHTFQERIRHFSSVHEINVKEQLIILIPQSCRTRRNLDENPRIERARELLPFHLDIGGIKKRVYNITVYQIYKPPNQDNSPEDSIRQAVEYAQPLHDIYDLHSKQKITENEMLQERQIFIQTLQKLLDDEDRSYETVLLLPYDDTSLKCDEAQLILNQHPV